MVSLAIDLAPRNPRELRLSNPIIAASGCFGFGTELTGMVDVSRLGGFVAPTITLRPRSLDRRARLFECPAGMLYVHSLPNPGLRSMLRSYPRIWEAWTTPVIVSIAASSPDDFAQLAETLDEVSGIAGIEINLSHSLPDDPNQSLGDHPDDLYALVEAVRTSTSLPVIAKLGAQSTKLLGLAQAAESAGADALAIVPMIDALVIDVQRKRPANGGSRSYLVGPAIKPIALRQVYDVATIVDLPIIGGGGIASLDDLLAFLMAGASAVQIGSAVFADPHLPERLVSELETWLANQGIASLEEIVGAAHSSTTTSGVQATTDGLGEGEQS